jgi:predicted permease
VYVLNTLAPIFLVVLLGAALRWFRFAPDGFFRQLNRLVYYVGLPVLLFIKTAQARVGAGQALRVSLVMIGGLAACVAVAYAVGRLLRLPGPSLASFVQGAYRGNLVYVGLPIVLYALAGTLGDGDEALEARAVLALAPLVPLNNALAVLVLLLGQPDRGRSRLAAIGRLLVGVLTNPLLLGCVAGIAVSLAGWRVPLALRRTCSAVGGMSLPLALLALGAALAGRSLRGAVGPALVSSVIKVGVGPLAGYAIALAMGLGAADLRMALIYLACPTAVVSFLMAEQLDCDGPLASAVVVLTTLLSIASFSIVLLL